MCPAFGARMAAQLFRVTAEQLHKNMVMESRHVRQAIIQRLTGR
jgi:hypothetical protein